MYVLRDIKHQSVAFFVTINFVTSYQKGKFICVCDTDCSAFQPEMAMPV